MQVDGKYMRHWASEMRLASDWKEVLSGKLKPKEYLRLTASGPEDLNHWRDSGPMPRARLQNTTIIARPRDLHV